MNANSIKELESLYVNKEMGFLEYIEKAAELGLEDVVLTNRVSLDLLLLANKGVSQPNETERHSLEEVQQMLKMAYPTHKVVVVAANSILDVGWKADLILFPNGQAGIPIQVKSSKGYLRAFRSEMKRRGKLCVNLREVHSSLPKLNMHIEPPASTRPHSKNLTDKERVSLIQRDVGYGLQIQKIRTA